MVCGQFNCLGAICSSVSRANPTSQRSEFRVLGWSGVSESPVNPLDITRQASPGPTAETNGLDSPPTNRRVLGPNALQTPPPAQVRTFAEFPRKHSDGFGFPEGRSVINRLVQLQVRSGTFAYDAAGIPPSEAFSGSLSDDRLAPTVVRPSARP